MLKRTSFILAAWMALVCPPCLAAVTGSPELNSLWEASVKSLQDASPEEGARLLQEWIELAGKQGIRSPEAHYNLGLAYWSSHQAGKAVYHLIESARLRSSPLGGLKAVHQLRSIEREIGIRDGLSQTAAFLAVFLLNRDWCLVLFAATGWLVVLAAFLAWTTGTATRKAQTTCVALAILATAAGLAGTVNRGYFGTLAVVDGESDSVPLFKDSEGREETKIIDLPVGTVVTLGSTTAKYTQVIRPILGWIPSQSLLTLERR